MAATSTATGSSFGGAQSTVGPGASAIPPSRRESINASLSAFIDKELGAEVARSLGGSVDIGQLAILTASLKTGLRSKVGASLGIGGGISAGGVGGTAGGGTTLGAGAGTSSALTGDLSGKVGGVASGGFSLGAGLGTRATAGFGLGGKVALGTAVGSNFGVGAQAGIGGSGSSPVKVGAGASIKTSVLSALDGAMVKLGLSGTEQSSLRAELKPAISQSVDDSFKSAFGPDVGYPNAGGVALLGIECTMQQTGAWMATCEVDHTSDDQKIPTGPFVFDIDGVEFRGTVVPDRSGAHGARQRVRVVGGAGGLDTDIPARNYAGGLTRARTIVGDILRDSGESLSIEASSDFLDRRVEGWQRARGKAKHALDAICQKLGCSWRVLRDGTVWIGEDKWPEVEPAGTVEDQDWGDGHITIAPDFPTLVPGVIVRGQRVQQVVYRFGGPNIGLRATLHTNSARGLLDGIQQRLERKTQYGYRYRCKVTRQNADGTVDVMIDDERMKGKGVSKCRMRFGLPGVRAVVSAGARCLVGWDDGDPALPYVDGWESAAAFETIDIG